MKFIAKAQNVWLLRQFLPLLADRSASKSVNEDTIIYGRLYIFRYTNAGTFALEILPYIKMTSHFQAKFQVPNICFCFIAPRSCRAEPCTSAELPDATKQTKNRARLLLATPQCRLAFSQQSWNIWYYEFVFFSIATRKCTVLTWPWATFGLLSCLV